MRTNDFHKDPSDGHDGQQQKRATTKTQNRQSVMHKTKWTQRKESPKKSQNHKNHTGQKLINARKIITNEVEKSAKTRMKERNDHREVARTKKKNDKNKDEEMR